MGPVHAGTGGPPVPKVRGFGAAVLWRETLDFTQDSYNLSERGFGTVRNEIT
jgi:hypothetical protein